MNTVIVRAWYIWDGVSQKLVFGPFENRIKAKYRLKEAIEVDPQNDVCMRIVPICEVVEG